MNQNFRIGIGLDSHKFLDDKLKPLILGGVEIPCELSLEADSDGDVILHSVFNAISQALGRRSIGYFVDGICLKEGVKDSKKYMEIVKKFMVDCKYSIENIGITVHAKRPRLEELHDIIKESIAVILSIKIDQIGLTFTTGDSLSDVGKGKGIEVYTICLLKKHD